MYCPNCRSEYRDGFIVCSDCDTELVNGLQPITTRKVGVSKKLSYSVKYKLFNSFVGIFGGPIIYFLLFAAITQSQPLPPELRKNTNSTADILAIAILTFFVSVFIVNTIGQVVYLKRNFVKNKIISDILKFGVINLLIFTISFIISFFFSTVWLKL